MNCCLLCLNAENKTTVCMGVTSMQWQAENIKAIIEKHFWPMNTTSPFNIVCISCWQQLDQFHRFYLIIEKAHATLGTLRNTSDVKETHEIENFNDEPKNLQECEEKFVESNVEAEILIRQPLPTECLMENENPLTKEADNEILRYEQPFAPRRKRGRTSKQITGLEMDRKDPLKKTNTNELLEKHKLKEASNKSKMQLKSPLLTKIENPKVRNELENLSNIFFDVQENSDSNSEHEDFAEKKAFVACRKKRKNPDKKTLHEHDVMIAEHLKMSCTLCQMPLDNFIALRKHFRQEHKRRGFMVCCRKKFFNRPVLVDHLNFHLDPNYFKCKQCEKVYSDRCTLEKHVKHHLNHGQGRNDTCKECGKSFAGTTQLENHKLTHAPDYKKKFPCSECGKFFATLYNLNYHIQAIHRNKYAKICDICGKTIRNSFKLHMQKHDKKLATPIHCDICGLRLIDNRSLKQHKNSQHPIGGKKEYACHICSKISPNLRALRTHVRFAHETGHIHKCTMCEKAFKRTEALKDHVATHTGTPLYSCPWCPKTFMSNGNMYNHRKNAHPEKWEELRRKKYKDTALK